MIETDFPHGLRHWMRVFGGFLRLDFIQAISYPLSFAMSQVAVLVPVTIYYFVAQLLVRPPSTVGGDYFTYVVIGLAGFGILGGGLRGFGSRLELALQQGQFEAMLIEPIKWRLLPFAMTQWSLILGTILGLIVLAFGGLLGAEYELSGIPSATAIVALAMVASVAIGGVIGQPVASRQEVEECLGPLHPGCIDSVRGLLSGRDAPRSGPEALLGHPPYLRHKRTARRPDG